MYWVTFFYCNRYNPGYTKSFLFSNRLNVHFFVPGLTQENQISNRPNNMEWWYREGLSQSHAMFMRFPPSDI